MTQAIAPDDLLTPGAAVAKWWDRVQEAIAIGKDGKDHFSAEKLQQAAKALRRFDGSEDIQPILDLLADQCELLAAFNRNLDTEAQGG